MLLHLPCLIQALASAKWLGSNLQVAATFN